MNAKTYWERILRYPDEAARKRGIQGRVNVMFTIGEMEVIGQCSDARAGVGY